MISDGSYQISSHLVREYACLSATIIDLKKSKSKRNQNVCKCNSKSLLPYLAFVI